MITKCFLLDVRKKALRKGIWQRVLDPVERGILFLASKLIDTIHSSLLNDQIVKILDKIKNAYKNSFVKSLEKNGMKRLYEIQAQASKFGNKEIVKVEDDFTFMRYLIFLDFNQPTGWRLYQ